jgi:hypothetical protein
MALSRQLGSKESYNTDKASRDACNEDVVKYVHNVSFLDLLSK